MTPHLLDVSSWHSSWDASGLRAPDQKKITRLFPLGLVSQFPFIYGEGKKKVFPFVARIQALQVKEKCFRNKAGLFAYL